MEENRRPAAIGVVTDFCANGLTRSNSVASSLTAENSEEILLQSVNVATRDYCTIWTNEKHNLYLDNLEVSFVKQLHQSMGLFTWCLEQKKNEKNMSKKRPAQVHNYMSADMQEYMELRSAEKQMAVEGIVSPGLATCSNQLPASNPCHGDIFGFMTEGTGQNFVDEDGPNNSNNESRVKRLRTALVARSSHDQIVPSGKCPMTNNSSVDGYILGGGEPVHDI